MASSTPWGQKPKVDTSAWSNRELYDDNERIMKEHDDILDSMYTSVKGTTDVARAIGQETEVHIGLLDDMNHSVIKNDTKIRGATAAAHDVEITSSTKVLWLIIILLIVLLVILVIVSVSMK